MGIEVAADRLECCRLVAVNAVEPSLASASINLISNANLCAFLIAVVDFAYDKDI
jgi:hypothetical protein